MHIHGERIILRAVEERDNQMLLSLINDPDTEIMLGGSSWPVSEAEQLKWFDNQEKSKDVLRCVIATKEAQEALGTIILSDIDHKNGIAQIHIKLSKEKGRGKGYGTEAIRALVGYAFNEMRLNCIYANVLCYNEISVKLFGKCGFKRDGVLRSRIYKGGAYVDVYSYSILKEECDYES